HAQRHHSLMEIIKIWNIQTRLAYTRPGRPGSNPSRWRPRSQVKREGSAVGCELSPLGRLESHGSAQHVAVERQGALHVAHKDDDIRHSHVRPPWLLLAEPTLHGGPQLVGAVGVGMVGAWDQLERHVREIGDERRDLVRQAAEGEPVWLVRIDAFLAADR